MERCPPAVPRRRWRGHERPPGARARVRVGPRGRPESRAPGSLADTGWRALVLSGPATRADALRDSGDPGREDTPGLLLPGWRGRVTSDLGTKSGPREPPVAWTLGRALGKFGGSVGRVTLAPAGERGLHVGCASGVRSGLGDRLHGWGTCSPGCGQGSCGPLVPP